MKKKILGVPLTLQETFFLNSLRKSHQKEADRLLAEAGKVGSSDKSAADSLRAKAFETMGNTFIRLRYSMEDTLGPFSRWLKPEWDNKSRLKGLLADICAKHPLLFMEFDAKKGQKVPLPAEKRCPFVFLDRLEDALDSEKHNNVPLRFIFTEGGRFEVWIDHLYADGYATKEILVGLMLKYLNPLSRYGFCLTEDGLVNVKSLDFDGLNRVVRQQREAFEKLKESSATKDAKVDIVDEMWGRLKRILRRLNSQPLSASLKPSADSSVSPFDQSIKNLTVNNGFLEALALKLGVGKPGTLGKMAHSIGSRLGFSNALVGKLFPSQILDTVFQMAVALLNDKQPITLREPRTVTDLPLGYRASSAYSTIGDGGANDFLGGDKSILDAFFQARKNAKLVREMLVKEGVYGAVPVEAIVDLVSKTPELREEFGNIYAQGCVNNMQGCVGGPPPNTTALFLAYYMGLVENRSRYGQWYASHEVPGDTGSASGDSARSSNTEETLYGPDFMATLYCPVGGRNTRVEVETRDATVKPVVGEKVVCLMARILNALYSSNAKDITIEMLMRGLDGDTSPEPPKLPTCLSGQDKKVVWGVSSLAALVGAARVFRT